MQTQLFVLPHFNFILRRGHPEANYAFGEVTSRQQAPPN